LLARSACNALFKPNPPDYSCSKCHSNATASFAARNRLKHERGRVMEEKHRLKALEEMRSEERCPDCGTSIRVGYAVERNPS